LYENVFEFILAPTLLMVRPDKSSIFYPLIPANRS